MADGLPIMLVLFVYAMILAAVLMLLLFVGMCCVIAYQEMKDYLRKDHR